MTYSDINIAVDSTGTYSFNGITSDNITRASNRFTILFLSSLRSDNRGSYMQQQIERGAVKTSSNIVSAFSLTAATVIDQLRQLALDLYPERADLIDFTIIDSRTVNIRYNLVTNVGNIISNIVVTASSN